ncbi:hypothetical protein KAZ01_04270, partial [Candidatus Gracilibacteria bacterium]|nr:hypothetical protein [Candidatus Gracilibacteria bacterium]
MKKLILIIFLFISFFAFFSICFCLEIPNILFSFQTPSYLIDKNTSLNEFYCDKTKPECKINFNLEGSFTGIYKSSNYV